LSIYYSKQEKSSTPIQLHYVFRVLWRVCPV